MQFRSALIIVCLCKAILAKTKNESSFVTEQFGSLYSGNFSLFFKRADNGTPVSAMHDIPLFTNEENNIFNMVVEIPRWTNAKMEINLANKLNPIRQDTEDSGEVRFVSNVFPHKGYIWNYGALPQTWEDPEHIDESTGQKGDGDPIDVCEIGQTVAKTGDVLPVKILGAIALIDEGETDWKLIAIDTRDPMADELNDVRDVETHMPGLIEATVEWFKLYKTPEGNPPNEIGFEEEPQGSEFALQVVSDVHELWKDLMARDSDPEDLSRACTQCESIARITAEEAQDVLDAQPDLGPDVPLDSEVDEIYFPPQFSGSHKLTSSMQTIILALLIWKMLFRN